MNFVPGSPQKIHNPSTPAGQTLNSPDLSQPQGQAQSNYTLPEGRQQQVRSFSVQYDRQFDPLQRQQLPIQLLQNVQRYLFNSQQQHPQQQHHQQQQLHRHQPHNLQQFQSPHQLHQLQHQHLQLFQQPAIQRTPPFDFNNARAVNNNSALSYNSNSEASPATSSSTYSSQPPISSRDSEDSKYSTMDGKRNSYSNGIDRDLIPNHNPFDFNSYPITNPPLIDATYIAYAPDGHPRRRRISISNGQIGQIVNHEAIFDSDFSLDDAYTQQGISNDDQIQGIPFQQGFVDDNVIMGVDNTQSKIVIPPHQQQQPQQQQQQPYQQEQRAGPAFNQNMFKIEPLISISQSSVSGPAPVVPTQLQPLQNSTMGVSGRGDQMQGIGLPNHTANSKPRVPVNHNTGLPDSLADAAGVPPPNHQLIYNNEVIYNPNDGPIPGTAAWKKERLLERNRIAASKCRQRKKQAQQELIANVSKYEKKADQMKEKINSYAQLVSVYNGHLSLFFKLGDPSCLEALRGYVDADIENAISMLERKTQGVSIKDEGNHQNNF